MRNNYIYTISFAAWASLSLHPSHAAIFDQDDRITVSTAPGSPYAPIGRVTREGIVPLHTTGTVLTSQHLFGQQRAMGRRVVFTAAIGTRDQASSRGTVVAAGGYEKHPIATELDAAIASDWIVVKLDTCLGRSLGFATIRTYPQTAAELAHVESAGYPADRPWQAGLTVDPSCAIRGLYAQVWLNDCAALSGNSGGPIFRVAKSEGRQQLEVYAIQSRAFSYRGVVPFAGGYENMATPVLIPDFQRLVALAASN